MTVAWEPTVGIALVAGALFLGAALLWWPHDRHALDDRISLRVSLDGPRPSRARELAAWTSRMATRALERRGRAERLKTLLERAGIVLEPGEWIVLVSAGAATATAFGLLVFGLVGGCLLGALTAGGFRVARTWKTSQRQARFADQLGDTLLLLSSSLRAGYGLLQALDSVAREADSPTSEEFGRLIVETRIGRTVPEALQTVAERIHNEDFDWIVEAITINREVGGELTEVLDRVGETIRERDRLRRQIKTLSAEGRLSAVFLVALPILLFLYLELSHPDYAGELTGSPVGWLLLGIGMSLLAIGGLWMRKLVRVVF